MGHLVTLSGDLDCSSVTGLRAAFAGLTAAGTIDMSEVRLVTSAALLEFLKLAQRIGPRKIVLLDVQPTILRLLHALGFDRIFLIAVHKP
jgi:anti-anti-sigma factor